MKSASGWFVLLSAIGAMVAAVLGQRAQARRPSALRHPGMHGTNTSDAEAKSQL